MVLVVHQVPGDGRELVATDPGAVKIRAEDGRSVVGVDISPFISNLPYGKDTRQANASGASMMPCLQLCFAAREMPADRRCLFLRCSSLAGSDGFACAYSM